MVVPPSVVSGFVALPPPDAAALPCTGEPVVGVPGPPAMDPASAFVAAAAPVDELELWLSCLVTLFGRSSNCWTFGILFFVISFLGLG